jgi:hypothetical protein
MIDLFYLFRGIGSMRDQIIWDSGSPSWKSSPPSRTKWSSATGRRYVLGSCLSLTVRLWDGSIRSRSGWSAYLDQNPTATMADLMFDSISIRKMSYARLTDKAGWLGTSSLAPTKIRISMINTIRFIRSNNIKYVNFR